MTFKSPQGGFTFIESLITLLVLSLIVTGFASVATMSNAGVSMKKDKSMAYRIAEGIQDEVSGLSSTDAKLVSGYTETRYYDFSGKSLSLATDPKKYFTAVWTVSTDSKAGGAAVLRKIDIAMSWNSVSGVSGGATLPYNLSFSIWRK